MVDADHDVLHLPQYAGRLGSLLDRVQYLLGYSAVLPAKTL
jgi:hypothetical protein